MNAEIVVLSLAAVAVVKPFVDIIRMAFDAPPRWLSPLFAVGLGIAVSFLLRMANGDAVTGAIAAQCVLAGMMAAVGAVGTTELQKKAG